MSAPAAEPGAGDPLTILVVNWLDRENPRSGGAERHLHEVFGRMADEGHRVTLLCSGWKGCAPRAELDGIDVHRVGRRYTFPLHARRYFRAHLAAPIPDVIVEDLNKVPLFTPRWSETPVVLLVHHLFGVTAFREANPFLAAATWLLERPVPRVFRDTTTIAISESTRRDLVRRGLPAETITVIPNGIDVEAYTPAYASPADAARDAESAPSEGNGEQRIGRPGGFPEPTILFLGRVKRYKRVDLVLRALVRLHERDVPARLRIAGKGDHVPALERLTHRLRLDEHVTFEGFVSEERKRELFRRSWVHVLTSPKEGWGISNLEAAASGTPTVASDSPGLRESVVDGETGFLVPHGDIERLADRLQRLLEDSALREQMGARARAFAEGFSWSASSRRVLDVLRGEVAGARRRD